MSDDPGKSPTGDARELAPTLPGLLDALERANLGLVVFVQRHGRMEKVYANEPAIQPLGYSVEEWLAKPMFEVIAAPQRQRVAELYDRFASDEPLPAVIELSFVRRER